ncbi:secretion system type IV pilin subunit VirB2 [Gluconobacter thailandicus F149-1 = NBRC 100600]|jgi:type IV secretion system protein VirB2|uniref:Type IV secretion system protein VirB2 n=6 Tax=Acetobacteraceae TaxID=433 RepID=A0A2S3VX09_9PROT|nr:MULTISPECIES: TrbC/VirB2 family protein [Acetobacteraceae]GBO81859.1 transport secretion system IV VirB2 protein [Acetobacter aceti NRIC 0242]KXV54341.1 type IV secretion system protein VirB2 [Gluconobacter thailandicus]KXV60160.1 type IV secretion system protein VirB2 [Acetobacter tropicalis]POF61136.1 hypothetical protein KMAL_32500 [Novacetimonas maltaceti]PYD57063.1 type IV secretion system protein VirB2 [Novacetimonas maltaceti]
MLSSSHYVAVRSPRLKAGLVAWVVFLSVLPAVAHAQTVSGGSTPTQMINNICTFILGDFGKSIAVVVLAAAGLMLAFGRLSLGIFAGMVGGILLMFGAAYLGSMVTG